MLRGHDDVEGHGGRAGVADVVGGGDHERVRSQGQLGQKVDRLSALEAVAVQRAGSVKRRAEARAATSGSWIFSASAGGIARSTKGSDSRFATAGPMMLPADPKVAAIVTVAIGSWDGTTGAAVCSGFELQGHDLERRHLERDHAVVHHDFLAVAFQEIAQKGA